MSQLKINVFKKKIEEGAIIVDTRPATEFTTGFIPGAIFIGMEGKFEEWASALLPRDNPILLVAAVGNEEEAEKRLLKCGFNKIAGSLAGGFDTWRNAGEKIDLIIDIEPDELGMDIPFDNNLTVLDVRTFEEFSKGHVKDAVNLPLNEMNDVAQLADFEENQNLYIHCAGGYRSVIAASLLKREGYFSVRNILGGFEKMQLEKSIPLQK